MTLDCHALADHLDTLLDAPSFDDYAPNGLQIEGDRPIEHVVVGVSANAALIERAIDAGADAILVHHGFFWRNDPRTITGLRYRRIAPLIRAGIALYGYHLPLDAHGTLGNNAGVLDAMGAVPVEAFGRPPIGWVGELPEPADRGAVIARLTEATGQAPMTFLHGPTTVRRIGVVTGGGAGFFEQALQVGADLFVTGEPSEQSQGLAAELGGNFVAAGHHATERFGPKRLGQHLHETFGVRVTFIDVANPV